MTTSLSPDARRIWLAARGPLVVAVIVLAAAIVMTLFSSNDNLEALDPDSVAPEGSRALAHLLEDNGVEIQRADTADTADDAVSDDTTLLIIEPNWVQPDRLARLRQRAATVVAIGATDDALQALAPGARTGPVTDTETRAPGCTHQAARAAGTARLGGVTYQAAQTCYDGTLAEQSRTTLLGNPVPLTNDALDQEGNAALALRLLGQHPNLVWYIPGINDSARGTGDTSFYDLIPSGWLFGLGQAAIAVVLFMLWRGRRLGPVVTEPLPVVVRAAETTEGRARLYRRAGATDHAADALRRATVTRLIPLLGLASDAPAASIAQAVSDRTGRPATGVHTVLFGPPPRTERALVELADQLDRLADEVGSP